MFSCAKKNQQLVDSVAVEREREQKKTSTHLSNVNGEKMKMYGIIKQL